MELRIRNATMQDLAAVTAVEAECFPAAEAATEKDFAARLAVYPEYFWLLECCGEDAKTEKAEIAEEMCEAKKYKTETAEITEEKCEVKADYGEINKKVSENWKLIGFVNGMVTDQPDLCDEMYENASMHTADGKWQMIFGVNTLPDYRRRGYAELILRRVIEDAKAQGRRGVVLTCKDKLVHYYAKFGFKNEGVSESVHGNVVWYQMRLKFDESDE